ncbi:MAG: HipA N-terminal domain-containing protein, partial [Solirubrobacterales bacterium]
MAVAEVVLWGRRIGAVSLDRPGGSAVFEYEPEFAASGFEPSPLVMPVENRLYQFPELSRTSFGGLPGLVADSLPDKFGNAVIDRWL